MSLDTLPHSSGSEPGTIARSARTHTARMRRRPTQQARREANTGVSDDLLPGLVAQDVEQEGGDERGQRPQPDRAVPAAARHGERTTLVTRQPCGEQEEAEVAASHQHVSSPGEDLTLCT